MIAILFDREVLCVQTFIFVIICRSTLIGREKKLWTKISIEIVPNTPKQQENVSDNNEIHLWIELESHMRWT